MFLIEYTNHPGSIESTHIAIARYAMRNAGDLSWFPLWYCGIPYVNTYPPLLHLTDASAALLLHVSPARAYHAVTAATYCLGPVALFWLAFLFCGSRLYSLAAGLLYSIFSPSTLLFSNVRHDVGGWHYPRRLQALVTYGEGPHVTSLMLLIVAIGCLHLALQKRTPARFVLAATAFASVVLTNWIGGVALGMAVAAYLLARRDGLWLRTLGIGALAWALACAWLPPSTIAVILADSQAASNTHFGFKEVVLSILVAAAALLIMKYLRASLAIRFSILFLLFTAAVTALSEWFHISLFPQPGRYHLALEIPAVLLAVLAMKSLLDRSTRRTGAIVLAAFLLFCAWQTRHYRFWSRHQIRSFDMSSTVEYEMAEWFDRNMKPRRVFAPSNVSFWLNVFSDTPQFGGGFDQGVLFKPYFGAAFGLYFMDKSQNGGPLGELWLKAYGVHAIGISGAHGREYYHPFRQPEKFAGVLPELWRDGDDVIYEVPQRTDSLAHVIRRSDLPTGEPLNGLDAEMLRRYVEALEDPRLPLASFQWRNRHEAVIEADMRRDQILAVAIAWHQGWHARLNGRPVRMYADKLGLSVVEPECDGHCRVDLLYDGGLEMKLMRMLSAMAVAGSLAAIGVPRTRPPARAVKTTA